MTAIVLRVATSRAEHERLARLARDIWHAHYPGIISRAQIDYMLAQGYHPDTLAQEQAAGAHLVIAYRHDTAAGFAGLSLDATDTPTIAWLDKLYVHARARGTGVGRALHDYACQWARDHGARALRLRVNRHNNVAIAVYQRLGFTIEAEDSKPIGHDFVMDDYIMAQPLVADD